ncbi:MAG: DM13 domain-containing protein [Microscillaceae bacterium]|jgi:hypothetical protein|nr:DM13 domain-containing protein [Microscillaceae bacterium]
MKRIPAIIGLGLLIMSLFACKKDEPAPINETNDFSGQTLAYQAGFIGSGRYSISGNAKVYMQDAKRTLLFENFKADNGPDLRVYLSKDLNASNFVDLGVLKSTSGNFTYQIGNQVNLSEQKFVLVWCRQFSVLFGYAELKP